MNILMIVHHRLWRAAYRSRVLAEGLVAKGHKVTLLCTADTARWRFREQIINGVRVVEAPDLTFGRLRSGWDPVAAWRRYRWLRRTAETFDLVHLFETRPATIFPGLAARRLFRAPLVIDWIDWWGRGGIISINRPWWYRVLFAWFETFFEEHFRADADATTVISYGLRDRAVALGVRPETILHLRNGANLTLFQPRDLGEARRRLGLDAEDFVVGYAAQDTFFDFEPMLEAIKRMARNGRRVRLACSGHAPPRVADAIRRFGLEEHSTFLGYLSWDDYPWFLPACDVLVVPFPPTVYNIGRWPGKFGEYAAAGRPIVFNPDGDLRDFAGEGCPGLTCSFTAEGFEEAFEALYSDPGLRVRLGQRARKLAEVELDWQYSVNRLAEFYGIVRARFETGGLTNMTR